MRRALSLAVVVALLATGLALHAQQQNNNDQNRGRRMASRYVRYQRVTVPDDDGDVSVSEALRLVGLRVYRTDKLLELTEAEKEKLGQLAERVRQDNIEALADILEGKNRELLLNYLENAKEFGPDLGFLNLTEMQKVKIRKHLTAYREQTRGVQDNGRRGRWNPALRKAQYIYSKAVLSELDEQQKKRLGHIQSARGVHPGNIQGEEMPENAGAGDDREGVPARPAYDANLSASEVVKVDVEKRTLTVRKRDRAGSVYPSGRTVVVVDRAEGKLADLVLEKPVLALHVDSSYRVDVLVQQTETPVYAVAGTFKGTKTGKLVLEGTLLDSVPVDDKTVVVNKENTVTTLEKLETDRPVWVTMTKTDAGLVALVVRGLEKGQVGLKTTSGILVSKPKPDDRYRRPLQVRDSLAEPEVELAVHENFHMTDYINNRRETLDLEAFAERYGGKKMTFHIYYKKADKEGDVPVAAFGFVNRQAGR